MKYAIGAMLISIMGWHAYGQHVGTNAVSEWPRPYTVYSNKVRQIRMDTIPASNGYAVAWYEKSFRTSHVADWYAGFMMCDADGNPSLDHELSLNEALGGYLYSSRLHPVLVPNGTEIWYFYTNHAYQEYVLCQALTSTGSLARSVISLGGTALATLDAMDAAVYSDGSGIAVWSGDDAVEFTILSSSGASTVTQDVFLATTPARGLAVGCSSNLALAVYQAGQTNLVGKRIQSDGHVVDQAVDILIDSYNPHSPNGIDHQSVCVVGDAQGWWVCYDAGDDLGILRAKRVGIDGAVQPALINYTNEVSIPWSSSTIDFVASSNSFEILWAGGDHMSVYRFTQTGEIESISPIHDAAGGALTRKSPLNAFLVYSEDRETPQALYTLRGGRFVDRPQFLGIDIDSSGACDIDLLCLAGTNWIQCATNLLDFTSSIITNIPVVSPLPDELHTPLSLPQVDALFMRSSTER